MDPHSYLKINSTNKNKVFDTNSVPENSVMIGFFVLSMEKRQQVYQNKTALKHCSDQNN